MDVVGGVVVVLLVLGVASLIYLSRSRARVMGYHDIPTPRVNESTHGAEGSPGSERSLWRVGALPRPLIAAIRAGSPSVR
jgi:hypothetical protein